MILYWYNYVTIPFLLFIVCGIQIQGTVKTQCLHFYKNIYGLYSHLDFLLPLY